MDSLTDAKEYRAMFARCLSVTDSSTLDEKGAAIEEFLHVIELIATSEAPLLIKSICIGCIDVELFQSRMVRDTARKVLGNITEGYS